jgi:DNA polymerase (family 10)
LQELPGIGKAIAEKIEEIIQTGKLTYYEELRREVPIDVRGLTSVEGVGPKSVKVLYEKLGVHDVSDLERVALAGKIRSPFLAAVHDLREIGFYVF